MRIAILGAHGQLGQEFSRVLSGEVVALKRDAADLTRPAELRQTLAALQPAIVINCAGYTLVDQAESEPELAFAVNAIGMRSLALACRELDCTLIHFSTDYVFGLEEPRHLPYVEDDPAGPVNVYGASKWAGETFVRTLCPKHFVVRTCGLYGTPSIAGKQGNFVQTMLRKGEMGRPTRVVYDQICTPTATCDLAKAGAQLLASEAYGLYHLTNDGACSWYEFAKAIFACTQCTAPLIAIRSDDYGAPARRPRYSVLANTRWIDQGFTPLRSWQEALEEHLARRNA